MPFEVLSMYSFWEPWAPMTAVVLMMVEPPDAVELLFQVMAFAEPLVHWPTEWQSPQWS